MHLCTIRGLWFQRDPNSVDIYSDGDPVAYIGGGIDLRELLPLELARWLFPVALAMMDALAGNPSNADLARVIVRAARAAGVRDEEIVVNPELREVERG